VEILPAADGWIFKGQGYGHGVGMCQFGANGMAKAGLGYRQILERYYPGVEIGRESP
jgi:stage II sporulation protein D